MLGMRFSCGVYGCTVRYNYIEKHYKPYQEVINCCIYHEKRVIRDLHNSKATR
ncbi:hypothetical protein ACO3VM_01390 [Methanocaldococcus sp. 10A]